MNEKSVKFRNECNQFLAKCEKIFAEMKTFNKVRYRQLVYDVPEEKKVVNKSLLLKDLFQVYSDSNDRIKIKTKSLNQTTLNSLINYKKGITIWDITPGFLQKFEITKREAGYSPATISSYYRHLRGVINHFMYVEKVIPEDYKYPFGKGGFSIKRHQNVKLVLSQDEIKSVVHFCEFENKEQEYARDIWLLLYRGNGMNYADLFRLKWTNIKGTYILFNRMKTENTRKNNIKEIVVPITPGVQELLDKVSDKKSMYILGKLPDIYDEETFRNKKDYQLQKLNKGLKFISEKLNLSVDLTIKTSRDCFATSLRRAGKSKDDIGEQMGHANSSTTENYLASLDPEKTWGINDCLL